MHWPLFWKYADFKDRAIWAARLLRHILISEALIPEFAERFRGITPAEARQLARSFRWESCTRRLGLEQTLRLELAKG